MVRTAPAGQREGGSGRWLEQGRARADQRWCANRGHEHVQGTGRPSGDSKRGAQHQQGDAWLQGVWMCNPCRPRAVVRGAMLHGTHRGAWQASLAPTVVQAGRPLSLGWLYAVCARGTAAPARAPPRTASLGVMARTTAWYCLRRLASRTCTGRHTRMLRAAGRASAPSCGGAHRCALPLWHVPPRRAPTTRTRTQSRRHQSLTS